MRNTVTKASENEAWDSTFAGGGLVGCSFVCLFVCFPLKDESFYLASALRHGEARLLSQH